jgi:hypothetical protein
MSFNKKNKREIISIQPSSRSHDARWTKSGSSRCEEKIRQSEGHVADFRLLGRNQSETLPLDRSRLISQIDAMQELEEGVVLRRQRA